MRQWAVWSKGKTGIIITFPEWSDREAREWMKDHEKYINQPGSPLEGATLELWEFETKAERHARYLQEIADHHNEKMEGEYHNNPVMYRYHEDRRNFAIFGLDQAGNGAVQR